MTSQSATFAAPYPVVFDAAVAAAMAAGFRLRAAVAQQGLIHADISMSFASWGEEDRIQVGAIDARTSGVTVWSSLKFGLVDWGRNRRNCERFLQCLSWTLANPRAPQADRGGH